MFALPPLRERSADILLLADWILQKASQRAGRLGMSLSPEAAEAMLDYRWPGNVRELNNALERAVALAPTETILLEDLPESIYGRAFERCSGEEHARHATTLKDLEREHISHTLAECATLDKAADALGINVTTLRRKRRRYGI